MKHFHIEDLSREIIASNLTPECKECCDMCNSCGNLVLECHHYTDKRYRGKLTNRNGIVFLCCNISKTTKNFRQKLEALSSAYPDIVIPRQKIINETREEEQKKINRLIHNLTSINAFNIQEIYDFVPQDILSSNWKKQVQYIEEAITSEPSSASLMFLRIAKNNLHMKSEFSIYRKLDREDNAKLDFKKHSIKKVILNVLHTFFSDFTNRHIFIEVEDYNGRVTIDYETIQVAFYHFFENALKYSKSYSPIKIYFTETDEVLSMTVEMTSYLIKPSEKEKIFSEGFSGSIPKSQNENGDGIGLWRIRQMLELNKGSIKLVNGLSKNGIFADNMFIIKLNK